MIQVDKSFLVNGRLVIAETIEDAIRIYKKYYKDFQATDNVEVTTVSAVNEGIPIYVHNINALYEVDYNKDS